MNTFENLVERPLKDRTLKPRITGLTMIIDKGLGVIHTKDLLEISHEWIDVAKFGFGTSRLCPENVVRLKAEVYRAHNVYVMPGGTLLEVVLAQDRLDEFLEEAKEVGFNAIEVSDGTLPMNDEQRSEVIRKVAGEGFMVLSEVGSKFTDMDLPVDEISRSISRDIDLGAFQVIVEAREGGKGIGIYDTNGDIVDEKLQAIVNGVDMKKVMFEAPHKNQQLELIQKFGVNVNLGNIQAADVASLEALRAGLRADTLRGIYGTEH
jgi:phosphosulfolactate synthase